MKNHVDFRQFLSESKDRLDISIQSADKWLTSEKKKLELLSTPVNVEQKTDGIKIQLIYKDNTGDFTKDWIVAYKGEIQYSAEFDFMSTQRIKKSSIANAQFKVIFDHLKKITPGVSGLKTGTEFFIEFLMKKPTLSSNYTHNHGMVLIAFSKTDYKELQGKLKSKPQSFNTDGREKIAKILKVDVPQFLFSGKMGSAAEFSKGIQHKALLSIYNTYKNSIQWDNPDDVIMNLKAMFLEVESKYGGVEEGVVIKYQDGSRYLKFQQSYQVDQEARNIIKMKYKEDDPQQEQNFWNNVRIAALSIIQTVTGNKPVKIQDFPEVLADAAYELKKFKLTFGHSKKNKDQILDDIQGNVKMILRKNLKGNNNFLFLGKMRILSKAHYSIIKKGLIAHDGGVVCLVTSKETKHTLDIRTKMLKAAFPDIEVIHHSTGNLFGIMQKAEKNINVILAGSDRVNSYREMLKNNPDLSVKETPRVDSDISASKIIANIHDEDYFKKNTPKQIHNLYNELVKSYK